MVVDIGEDVDGCYGLFCLGFVVQYEVVVVFVDMQKFCVLFIGGNGIDQMFDFGQWCVVLQVVVCGCGGEVLVEIVFDQLWIDVVFFQLDWYVVFVVYDQ